MQRLLAAWVFGFAMLAIPASARADKYIIHVANTFFSPADLSALTRDQIIWTWISGFHSVTADDALFDSGIQIAPNRYWRVFQVPGDYFYHCKIHGGPGGTGMSGVVRISSRDHDDDDD